MEERIIRDERNLDDNLIEHYSDQPFYSGKKWLNVDSCTEVANDVATEYEIDFFDEYCKQPHSRLHLLDVVEDKILAYRNMDLKPWVALSSDKHVEILDEILELLTEAKV